MYELGTETAAIPQLTGEILAAGTAFTTCGMIWLAVNAVILLIVLLLPGEHPSIEDASAAGSESDGFRHAA